MGRLTQIPAETWPRALGWLVPGENVTGLGLRICQRAMLDVGILEVPNGSNRGTRIDRYTKRSGLPVSQNGKANGEGWYWCGIWLGAVFADCGCFVPEGYAAVDAWLEHLTQTPIVGAAIIYGTRKTRRDRSTYADGVHCGIVVREPEPSAGQTLRLTIEGNRGFAGGASNNGLGVDIAPVFRKDVLGYVHPRLHGG